MEKVINLNGEEYLICNDLFVDNVNYLYAISLEGSKYTLLTRKNVNGVDTVESVTDEAIIKKVFEIISKEESN